MNKVVFFIVLLILTSCGSKALPKENEPVNTQDTIVADSATTNAVDYSNPALIAGTDFGNFFKTLYAQGKFEEMVKFTSNASIQKHGKASVEDFYENKLKFGYELGKLKSMNTEDGIYTLNYPNSNIMATKKVVRLKVCVENDSTKIILPDVLKDISW